MSIPAKTRTKEKHDNHRCNIVRCKRAHLINATDSANRIHKSLLWRDARTFWWYHWQRRMRTGTGPGLMNESSNKWLIVERDFLNAFGCIWRIDGLCEKVCIYFGACGSQPTERDTHLSGRWHEKLSSVIIIIRVKLSAMQTCCSKNLRVRVCLLVSRLFDIDIVGAHWEYLLCEIFLRTVGFVLSFVWWQHSANIMLIICMQRVYGSIDMWNEIWCSIFCMIRWSSRWNSSYKSYSNRFVAR